MGCLRGTVGQEPRAEGHGSTCIPMPSAPAARPAGTLPATCCVAQRSTMPLRRVAWMGGPMWLLFLQTALPSEPRTSSSQRSRSSVGHGLTPCGPEEGAQQSGQMQVPLCPDGGVRVPHPRAPVIARGLTPTHSPGHPWWPGAQPHPHFRAPVVARGSHPPSWGFKVSLTWAFCRG